MHTHVLCDMITRRTRLLCEDGACTRRAWSCGNTLLGGQGWHSTLALPFARLSGVCTYITQQVGDAAVRCAVRSPGVKPVCAVSPVHSPFVRVRYVVLVSTGGGVDRAGGTRCSSWVDG